MADFWLGARVNGDDGVSWEGKDNLPFQRMTEELFFWSNARFSTMISYEDLFTGLNGFCRKLNVTHDTLKEPIVIVPVGKITEFQIYIVDPAKGS